MHHLGSKICETNFVKNFFKEKKKKYLAVKVRLVPLSLNFLFHIASGGMHHLGHELTFFLPRLIQCLVQFVILNQYMGRIPNYTPLGLIQCRWATNMDFMEVALVVIKKEVA